jgi:hypothetical protein
MSTIPLSGPPKRDQHDWLFVGSDQSGVSHHAKAYRLGKLARYWIDASKALLRRLPRWNGRLFFPGVRESVYPCSGPFESMLPELALEPPYRVQSDLSSSIESKDCGRKGPCDCAAAVVLS